MAKDITTPTKSGSATTKLYRSFEEANITPKEGDKELALWNGKSEFPANVEEMIERGLNANLDRKSFLTFMGASLSMAALAACREPVEKIVPYVDRPMDYVPGEARYFASTHISARGITPILVKTREGKPIKIEGLKDHPVFKGSATADVYASIWDLYDPDRVKHPLKRNGGKLVETKWDDILAEISGLLKNNARILGRVTFSPAEEAARAKLGKSVIYDPTGTLSEVVSGNRASLGSSAVPALHFDAADVILAIEADFLGTYLAPETYTRQFASRRDPAQGPMNRLVVAETTLSLTGSNADKRFALTAGTHTTFAFGLANLILPGSALAGDATVRAVLQAYTPAVVEKVTGIKEKDLVALAEELKAARGKSLVVGGGVSSRTLVAGELQIAVNLLNALLGNEGKTISTKGALKANVEISDAAAIEALIADMKADKVQTLVIDRANPIFELPLASGFADALKKVKNVVMIGDHINDTANVATHVLPVSHYLESWSDALAHGTYGIVQPMIRQIHNTLPVLEIYARLAGNTKSAYDQVKASHAANAKGQAFNSTLAAGFSVVDAQGAGAARTFRSAALKDIKAPVDAQPGYRLTLIESVGLGDGVGGNISFRHELPDPVTKITWDNVLLISPADAKTLKIATQDLIKVTAGKVVQEIPAFVQPGIRRGSMALAIGFGQSYIGQVGAGVGQNAYALQSYAAGQSAASGLSITIEKVGKYGMLASTQRHYEFSVIRGLARQVEVKTFEKAIREKNPDLMHEHEERPFGGKAKGLYPKHKYDEGYRWNLNIDLSKCTGCSACVMACYSENNIPAVGKAEVDRGREMSWLRIDRYYIYENEAAEKADADMVNPDVFFQPVMCQHCENAPCENVCPVGATGHSSEGLNYMAYNRCIGTRYCSNNCPYKVRRFNWFENWEHKLRDPQQFALNPDVTVRSRGVIEKCSFCQQRIAEKRQLSHIEGRAIRDGEIQTACQEACTAGAITFGNINSAETQIVKANSNPRSYEILAQLNVKPSVKYMVRIKNRPEAKA
ncbi:MAG: 4Fe-4S dicluster domain-containing protein [Spirochaetes bacterium]|nr:4Fe-4S dicluster domain-containing protein [Spirochaetota bacterium]